jgi:hypothetical protein
MGSSVTLLSIADYFAVPAFVGSGVFFKNSMWFEIKIKVVPLMKGSTRLKQTNPGCSNFPQTWKNFYKKCSNPARFRHFFTFSLPETIYFSILALYLHKIYQDGCCIFPPTAAFFDTFVVPASARFVRADHFPNFFWEKSRAIPQGF